MSFIKVLPSFVGRFCETPRGDWRLTQTPYNLGSVVISSSFGPQRFDWIHFRGTTGGEKTSDQCDRTEEEGDRAERERILGARVEEHRSHGARSGEGGREADDQAEADEFSTLRENEAEDIALLRAGRHA